MMAHAPPFESPTVGVIEVIPVPRWDTKSYSTCPSPRHNCDMLANATAQVSRRNRNAISVNDNFFKNKNTQIQIQTQTDKKAMTKVFALFCGLEKY